MKGKEWIEQGKERLRRFGLKEWGTLLLIGICCLIIVFPANRQENTDEDVQQGASAILTGVGNSEEKSYAEQMEERLEELLSDVEHVGRVKVMITVNATEEKNVLKDGRVGSEEISETDSEGGTRTSKSNESDLETVYAEENGTGSPYLVSEIYPDVVGVVVLAEGSGTGSVDYDILNAVQVLFDIPAHKIKIMKMK